MRRSLLYQGGSRPDLEGSMALVIHDTLSGDKTPFEPRDPRRVTLYVCGPTVYNYAHIGNARPVVVFDVLFRLLRRLYGEDAVVYARNITDVDDKINAKARAEGVDISVVTDRFAAIYEADMAALGALSPTVQPRATQHIGEMLAQIGQLIDHGAAYAAEGHVMFDTTAYARYGELSKRSLDDMIAGARVEVAPYKRNPADFVLWKPSKPGEPVWDSPWGPGRPGWHIECSAMSETVLGLPIDIHGGGHDLTFPHHENEIAQGVCAHQSGRAGDPRAYARYWMHNGFLTMDAEKMSKSLGNVLLVHDLVEKWPGEVIRWALLSGHYRAPLNWTDALLEQAKASLDRLYGVLQRAKATEPVQDPMIEAVSRALEDDLNTSAALAVFFGLSDALEKALLSGDKSLAAQAKGELLASGALLGFLQQDPDAWFTAGADEDLKPRIEALMQARAKARAEKDWAASDRLRAELNDLGVEVLDGKDGATWRFKG
jgi:cysteinyl-tRNA synthetase